jgi:hypothetical protein
MASTIAVLKTPRITKPKWSVARATPGEEVELSVSATDCDGMEVWFEIRNAAGHRLAFLKADGTWKQKWTAPMNADLTADGTKYSFLAILRQKPTPANGHLAVIQTRPTKKDLAVKGTKLSITTLDGWFVPKQEKLAAKFKLEGEAPANGRIEIWGERYPTDKPIYAEDFVPAAGDKDWNTWCGGENPEDNTGEITADGPLKDKYLTPEFSPYRMRVIVGPNDEAVKDPYGKGLGKTAMDEKLFEVDFKSVHIRLVEGPVLRKTKDCKIGISASPQNYAPGDKFTVTYTLTGTAPAAGRYEIWGTGYGDTPVYTTTFAPAGGAATWDVWNGQGNTGALNGAKITPAYAPYKVRVVVGSDDEAVKDPFGEGLGKVALDEVRFELDETTDAAQYKYRLGHALAIEKSPAAVDGTYKATGRLPKEGESGRIRIPMANHTATGEDSNHTGDDLKITGGYTAAKKYNRDLAHYTRPQLPIEFELHLKSREASFNTDVDHQGIFEADATGPAQIEPIAEDYYRDSVFTTGHATHQAYYKNAYFKIKSGTHNAPMNGGAHPNNKPKVRYWRWRRPLTADVVSDTTYNMAVSDADRKYKVGANELAVWLDRTKLVRTVDYDEVGAANTVSTRIKLKKNIAKRDQVLWVVRSGSDNAEGAVVNEWRNFPPGLNCHHHYGGLSGAAGPTWRRFFADYAADPGGVREPIIGKVPSLNPFAFKDFVNLKPDPVHENSQERVVSTAMLTNPVAEKKGILGKKGLAAVLFSPSYIAGDSYVLKARVDADPYERSFGYEPLKATLEAKTGDLAIWRTMRIHISLRLPDVGTVGLRPTVGSAIDAYPRTHPGNGTNMSFERLNSFFGPAFNEWNIPPIVKITGATSANPISITAPAHGLTTGDCVKIRNVGGNAAANGTFVIRVVDVAHFTLHLAYDFTAADGVGPGVNGAAAGAYTSGGEIDFHRGFNLKSYQVAYDTMLAAMGDGALELTGPDKIENQFTAWDHYRVQLPPNYPANRRKVASEIIKGIARGTGSVAAMNAVATEIARRVIGLKETVFKVTKFNKPAIPVFVGSVSAYNDWVEDMSDDISDALLNAVTPKAAVQPPKTVPVVRWPVLYHETVWNDGMRGAFGTNNEYTTGFYAMGGQSFFKSNSPTDTFEHEMGHSCHLSHLIGSIDFNWKHHDLNFPQCLESYDYTVGYIPKPPAIVGVTGGPATPGTGWPDTVPAPKPDITNIDAGAVAGEETIKLGRLEDVPIARAEPCAKCILKLKGWNEEVLPCAWDHPDLF